MNTERTNMNQNEQFEFVFRTKFDVGEKVHIKQFRSSNFPAWVEGEIKRILISKDGRGEYFNRYDVSCLIDDEWCLFSFGEDVLTLYDTTYSAFPRLLQIVTD